MSNANRVKASWVAASLAMAFTSTTMRKRKAAGPPRLLNPQPGDEPFFTIVSDQHFAELRSGARRPQLHDEGSAQGWRG